ATGVVAQIGHAQSVIGSHHDDQRIFDGRGLLIVAHHALGAVGGSEVGATAQVIIGNVDFVLSHGVDQVAHAHDRVLGVGAVGIARHEFLGGVERFVQRFGVAFGQVLARQ